MIAEARQTEDNEIFTTGPEHYNAYKKRMSKYADVLVKNKIPEHAHDDYFRMTYEGLMSQIFNAPVDLFIEQIIYDRPEMRPVQLLGLMEMIQLALQAATSSTIKKIAPPFVRSANISMTAAQLMQIRDLYGVDFLSQIKETNLKKKGESLYDDYLDMKEDKVEGEEYDLIRWWAEDLKIDKYFSLSDEVTHQPQTSIVDAFDFIKKLESDPYSLNDDIASEQSEMAEFIRSQSTDRINIPVLYYMTQALKYFTSLDDEKIKNIGYEIAELGRTGIDPSSADTYTLHHVPNQTFSGYRLLSWMYVAWSLTAPQIIPEMQLPYEKEYAAAQRLSALG